jgi:hypothetical protein
VTKLIKYVARRGTIFRRCGILWNENFGIFHRRCVSTPSFIAFKRPRPWREHDLCGEMETKTDSTGAARGRICASCLVKQ